LEGTLAVITIEINDPVVTAALDRLAAHLADMTPAMQEIGEALTASTQDRMAAGLQPDGASFAPRSAVTVARYEQQGLRYGNPLNQSGILRGGIFPQAEPDQVRVGSNAIQAAVMQFGAAQGAFGRTARGGPIPWGDIPARPFLGLSDADRTNIGDIVSEWLERAVE
jgi:phage virion morphogenesis protein